VGTDSYSVLTLIIECKSVETELDGNPVETETDIIDSNPVETETEIIDSNPVETETEIMVCKQIVMK